LSSFFQWLPTNQIKLKFLEQITSIVCHYTWNSISLLFICIAIKELTVDSSLNLSTLCVQNLCQILKCSLTTHEPFIRSSVQTILLQAFLKHTKITDLFAEAETFQLFVDSINMFSVRECLQYEISSWSSLVDWFRELALTNEKNLIRYVETEFNEFIERESSGDCDEFTMQSQSAKLTKLILIECDCLKQTEKQIFSKPIVVDSLRDKLTNCNRNIYMSKDRVEKCLFIFNFMISFVNHSKSRDKNSFKTVKFMYNECTPHVIDYLMRRMSEADLYFGKLQFYINLLENLIDFDFDSELGLVMPLVSDKLVKQMLPLIESNLNMAVSNEFSSEWKRFICLAMYICLIRSLKLNNTKSAQLIEFALRNKQTLIRLRPLSKSYIQKLAFKNNSIQADIMQDLVSQYSEFNGQYLQKVWQSNSFLIQHDSSIDLLDEYADSLELASPHCLASLIECSQCFRVTPSLMNVFQSIFKLVWEIREDSRLFNDSYQKYLQCLLTNEVFKSNSHFLIDTLIELIEKSAEKVCMIRPLVDRLVNMLGTVSSNENEFFIEIVLRLLTFGDVYRKEKKNVKQIEIYIESYGESFGANQLLKAEYLHDSGVRITTLLYLLQSSNLNEHYYSELIRKLIAKDESLAETNQKLFINSLVHRERFRLWQVVLVMLNKLKPDDFVLLMDVAERYLVSENQPSMRILIEWVVIKILAEQINSYDLFALLAKLDQFSHKRVGYTCSWMAILTHIIAFIEDKHKRATYFNALIAKIFSQIFSNSFHVRTYVEAILIKMYTCMYFYSKDKIGSRTKRTVHKKNFKFWSNFLFA